MTFTLSLDLDRLLPPELEALELEASALADAFPARHDAAGIARTMLEAIRIRRRLGPTGATTLPVDLDPDVTAEVREGGLREAMAYALALRDRNARYERLRDVWATVLADLDAYRDDEARQLAEFGRAFDNLEPDAGDWTPR